MAHRRLFESSAAPLACIVLMQEDCRFGEWKASTMISARKDETKNVKTLDKCYFLILGLVFLDTLIIMSQGNT